MVEDIPQELREISNEQFNEVHKCLANKRLLEREYNKKIDQFMSELDAQYQPLFAIIDAEIAEILSTPTPPNERLQES